MTTAIIQARMSSRRFPGKVLYDLNGKPLLKHVIDRVGQAKQVTEVIVATAAGTCEAIIGHCDNDWNCRVVRAPNSMENDVLRRFVLATSGMEPEEYVVRVCGDNPLIVPTCIDALVVRAGETRCDYAGYRTPEGPAILSPTGYFAEVVRVEALCRANAEVEEDHPWRQHVTMCMYDDGADYRCEWLPLPAWYAHEHCPPFTAIDTPEDLARVEGYLEEYDEYDPEKNWPFR
jgi:spore coat polysaccharide biosynthesis protein SpsF